MPELPEVETVMRGLASALQGQKLVRVDQRRANLRRPFPPDFRQRLEGRRIEALSRRGKYILADLDDRQVLIIHLGMTGRFQVESGDQTNGMADFYYVGPRDIRHDHVVFHLSSGVVVTYNDARRFGFIDVTVRSALDAHPALAKLGVEPLGNRLDAAFLLDAAGRRAAPLKALLMDQGVIAGLGNIYASEALFRARLHPERAASSLKAPEALLLVEQIKAVLQEAIAAGGSTLRDFTHANGASGDFQERFFVYDREGQPCSVCRTPILRLVQGGRSTFFCSRCQPRRSARLRSHLIPRSSP